MFVKNAVFFMAFVAFVNAMPVAEHRRPGPNSSTRIGTIIQPFLAGQGVSDGTGFWKREPHLGFPTKGATKGVTKGITKGITKGVYKGYARSSPGLDTDGDIDHPKSPSTASKPPPPPHGTGGSKGGNKAHVDTDDDDRLKSSHHEKGHKAHADTDHDDDDHLRSSHHGKEGHKAHVDTDHDDDRSRSPSTTSKPPSPPHGTGGSKPTAEPDLDSHIGVPIVHPKRAPFGTIFRELENILAGQAATSNFQSRSVAIDSELLTELQALVNVTITLLRAEGKDDSVNPFQTQIDALKSEVESGSVPTGELIRTAYSIASSYL
ncbi:hypothetical protein BDM02DRAFT_3124999 [Thelephora ganbajun]|uniref:Uncharacterized protein n=1 Tax=Thelephora ganbajun TaxID=370292 RepID=A0ACB6YWY2_THEGA|nr:hypothetical protein BDM02DRAFT_3124999 [Thelephora ganbajun]